MVGTRFNVMIALGIAFLSAAPPVARAQTTANATEQERQLIQQVEAGILALKDPSDTEGLSKVMAGLAAIQDPDEQQRLRDLLDNRYQKYLGIEEMPGPSAPQGTGSPDLATRIEQLRLGPDATVEDFQARDEVVAAINALEDPIARETLLNRLTARERAAESPRTSSKQ